MYTGMSCFYFEAAGITQQNLRVYFVMKTNIYLEPSYRDSLMYALTFNLYNPFNPYKWPL